MNSQVLKMIKQRNMCLIFGIGMLLANILLSFCMLYKTEKIVLVPPEINKTFWISNNAVSEGYLSEMAVFLSGLLLDQTSISSKVKRDILLKYVSSEFHNSFYSKLLKQEKYIKESDLTTKFSLKEIEADVEAGKVIVTGEMRSFVAMEELKKEIVSYELSFESRGFRYLLNGFRQLREGNEN